MTNLRSALPDLPVALAVLLAAGSPALAQSVSFPGLEGHSIVARYDEAITTRRGEVFRYQWNDRVYFSTKGRIFHRFSVDGDRPGRARTYEAVGDEQGVGDGRMAKYRWTGSGITRQWRNPRGVTLRQTIDISATAGGYACRMAVERISGSRGSATPVGQTCRVVRGNAVAGQ